MLKFNYRLLTPPEEGVTRLERYQIKHEWGLNQVEDSFASVRIKVVVFRSRRLIYIKVADFTLRTNKVAG